MPYAASNLTPLLAADSFCLWLYRTGDTRSAVLSSGYFRAARAQLLPGHVILLQASDATAFVPVRGLAELGNGLVLDAASSPLRLAAAGVFDIEADLAAPAVARWVSLDPLPAGVNEGETFTVRATAGGATAALVFSVVNAAGGVVRGPTSAAVSGGAASVTFAAPSPGTGYRVRVEDAADRLVAQVSPSFVVLAAFALLIETGLSLIAESGSRLVM